MLPEQKSAAKHFSPITWTRVQKCSSADCGNDLAQPLNRELRDGNEISPPTCLVRARSSQAHGSYGIDNLSLMP